MELFQKMCPELAFTVTVPISIEIHREIMLNGRRDATASEEGIGGAHERRLDDGNSPPPYAGGESRPELSPRWPIGSRISIKRSVTWRTLFRLDYLYCNFQLLPVFLKV